MTSYRQLVKYMNTAKFCIIIYTWRSFWNVKQFYFMLKLLIKQVLNHEIQTKIIKMRCMSICFENLFISFLKYSCELYVKVWRWLKITWNGSYNTCINIICPYFVSWIIINYYTMHSLYAPPDNIFCFTYNLNGLNKLVGNVFCYHFQTTELTIKM